jgi:chorismate mutase/prephenate dehydratase
LPKYDLQAKGVKVDLTQLRCAIDGVDDKILALLHERMGYVQQVGHLKHATQESIYRPERERSILERLSTTSAINGWRLKHEAIEAIFMEIFAVSRNLEKPESVAFLGPQGSFTHQAAESRFGSVSEYVSMNTIAGVFKAIENAQAKFGVIPIENNIEGVVSESIDLLGRSDVRIVAEMSLKIHHCLATRAQHLTQIKRIYSKDVAYNQCRQFVYEHSLDGVEFIPVSSTAKAAVLAASDEDGAAICSAIAAKINNLPIMFDNIEDNGHNETRFLVISDFLNAPSGRDKSSILVRLDNHPGALAKFLSLFSSANINLTKIESRPAKDAGFSYQFFVDFEGHFNDEAVQTALCDCPYPIKWLGSYAKGV